MNWGTGFFINAGADLDAGMEIFAECGVSIFSDGFESGDTAAWSGTVP